jgi:AraC family transcriptional regulator of adaptative response / DNA-3-methyladenine glycosylase II
VLNEDRCFRALRARDARFDGRFFVAVRTTGIYCRPVCPARPAKRENLRFFTNPAAAENAGFRPCRRCRPETAPGSPAWIGTPTTVARALRMIADGALDLDGVDGLAARLGVGDRHLRRLFLRHLGATPVAVARTRRAHFARRLIDETRLPMTEVAFAAGFRSLRQFNAVLHNTFGAAPTVLRHGARTSHPTGDLLTLQLPVRPPFDPAQLLRFLGRRTLPGVEDLAGDSYRRWLRLGGEPVCLDLQVAAGAPAVVLRLSRAVATGLMGVVQSARRFLDLDADGAAVHAQLRRDPVLAPLLPKPGALRLPGTLEPFELLVRAVLGQQVSVVAARTLAGRVVDAFGDRVGETGPLTHLFPTPDRLAEADLAGFGLPAARGATLRALARAVADGRIRMGADAPFDATRAALQEIPGIGPWTAEYVALRGLGDPDAFPASDLGLRQALAGNGRPLSASELARRAEAWRPWRGYAAFALWHSLGGSSKPPERKEP